EARSHLQPVLHDQGPRHGPRDGDREEDRRGPHRDDRGRERRRPRDRVPGDAAAAGEVKRMSGRILIVDDEKAILVAVGGLFTKEGYEVDTASSGEEAVRRMEAARPHVIVTDLSMDGMTGMQVLERARAVDPDVAVVMITAHGS